MFKLFVVAVIIFSCTTKKESGVKIIQSFEVKKTKFRKVYLEHDSDQVRIEVFKNGKWQINIDSLQNSDWVNFDKDLNRDGFMDIEHQIIRDTDFYLFNNEKKEFDKNAISIWSSYQLYDTTKKIYYDVDLSIGNWFDISVFTFNNNNIEYLYSTQSKSINNYEKFKVAVYKHINGSLENKKIDAIFISPYHFFAINAKLFLDNYLKNKSIVLKKNEQNN